MEYIVRPATLQDIDFIIETIIQAEKSGTNKLGLATLFNLSEQEVRICLYSILEEEIEGCEFSINSFLVAEYDGRCVAAVGGWIEGDNEDGQPSAVLKANLIGYHFPQQSITFAKGKADIIKDIQIERSLNSYQIEYVFVKNNHRGNNLAGKLIEAHIKDLPKSNDVCVQVFSNNLSAIKSYEKLGFEKVHVYKSDNTATKDFLPYYEKILMKKL